MGYSLPSKHVTLYWKPYFIDPLTCVPFEFNRWYFDGLRKTLDKIVNFIDVVYRNDTKYIILQDYESFRYWTLEIITIFVPSIALILITSTFLNMDIHTRVRQVHMEEPGLLLLVNWIYVYVTFRNRVQNSSSNIHHKVCSPSVSVWVPAYTCGSYLCVYARVCRMYVCACVWMCEFSVHVCVPTCVYAFVHAKLHINYKYICCSI